MKTKQPPRMNAQRAQKIAHDCVMGINHRYSKATLRECIRFMYYNHSNGKVALTRMLMKLVSHVSVAVNEAKNEHAQMCKEESEL